MKFFLYDNLDNLIAVKTQAFSAKLTEELQYYDLFEAEFPKTPENIRDFQHTMHIGIPVEDTNEYQLFKIERPEFSDTISISGVESASDDLDVQGYIDDRRFQDKPLSEVLKSVFDGSQWTFELHTDDVTNSTNFYRINRKKALQKVLETWNVEVQFRYETMHNRIVKKVCHVFKEIGKETNKRLIKGKNVISFKYSKDQTDLYTAAIGRGAGLAVKDDQGQETGGYSRAIEFDDVEWSKSAGDPVDKPKGQKYVEIPESTARFGWIDKEGNRQPRLAIIDFADDKDPTELLIDTYNWLLARSEPAISVSTNVAQIGNVSLGDRMVAIDYGYKLTVKARARKISRNLLNNNDTSVELGNYTILSQLERDESAKDYVEQVVKRTQDQITEETDNKLDTQDQKFDTYIAEIQQGMKLEGQAREQAITELQEKIAQESEATGRTIEDLKSETEQNFNSVQEIFTEELSHKVGQDMFDQAKEATDQMIEEINQNLEETQKELRENFAKQVENINQDIQDIRTVMASDTSGAIQLIKDKDNPNKIDRLIANNTDGSSLLLNGNGLEFRDRWGNTTSAVTRDGHIAADRLTGTIVNAISTNSAYINGGTIQGTYITGNTISGGYINGSNITGGNISGTNLSGSTISGSTIVAGTVYGALKVYDSSGGSMNVSIGGNDGGWSLYPSRGGDVIHVGSSNYESMMSSGQFAVRSDGGETHVYGTSININGNTALHSGNWKNYIDVPSYGQIKSWVQSWVADYVTETATNGHRLIIWKG